MSIHVRACRKICLLTIRVSSPVDSRSVSLSFPRNFATGRRNMAAGARKEFLCIIPDKPNVLALRKQVKATHYECIKPLIASGKLVAGGAMLESHPVEGEQVLFKGSMIIYTGESTEEVKEIINKDIYAKSGVWDLEKAQIIPYISAVREPLT